VASSDTVILSQVGYGINTANYAYRHVACASGSFVMAVKNITGGALAETPTIQFNVQKGAIA
jgi:hypothetical protein